jgi:hypothetical protein
MKMSGRAFDVNVLVLARPTFRGKDSAAVDLLEIAIRKLVPSFGILGEAVVDAQIPSSIFSKAMRVDEFVSLGPQKVDVRSSRLFRRRRTSLA